MASQKLKQSVKRVVSLSICILASALEVHSASVSTSSPEATRAALEILHAGGNAVDAACAAAFTLNVTQPYYIGMGGGGLALLSMGKKSPQFYDFREVAPQAVHSQLFFDENGKVIPVWQVRNTGPKAVGVPGLVAGCGKLVRDHGKLSFEQVLAPAIRVAENGFIINRYFEGQLALHWARISRFPHTQSLFKGRDHQGLKSGELFKQPQLAQTLRKLGKFGPESFYKGKLASQWLSEARKLGLPMTEKDLSSFFVRERVPVSVALTDQIWAVTAVSPSSSSLTLISVLRYLNHYYKSSQMMGQPDLAETVRRYVATIEAKAYFIKFRNRVMSDPVRMTFDQQNFFASPSELQAWKEIDDLVQRRLRGGLKSRLEAADSHESGHTAHMSVVDDLGNQVALTGSVGNIFGSGIVLPQSGFVLNSTLGDFSAEENSLNGPASQMRPLSNMSPTFFYERMTPQVSETPKSSQMIAVLGAAGGPLIPSCITDFVQNYLFFKLDSDRSIRSPRVHPESGSKIVIEEATSQEIIAELRSLGYEVDVRKKLDAVFEGVVRRSSKGKWDAVAETRFDGLGVTE
jgi:gamma-glutamyltranspeptidase/glutathione hydrolase